MAAQVGGAGLTCTTAAAVLGYGSGGKVRLRVQPKKAA